MAVYSEIAEAALDSSNIIDNDVRLNYHCEAKKGRKSNMAVYKMGGFCIAFPMFKNDDPNSKICYRVWFVEDYYNRKFKEICEHVSRMIRDFKLPYFVEYTFLPHAIKVGEEKLPGVKMKWIDGLSLNEWLRTHRDKAAIQKLADSFMQMCKDFHKFGISHGDLSNSNILINERAEIKLVDYDSVFTPSMGNQFYQTTAGQDAFQHRERRSGNHQISARDDNFSQQIIYLSLLAMAHDVSLVDWIGENELLFNQQDLASESDFIKSRAYKALSSLNEPEIQSRLKELKSAIRGSLSDVRSIVELEVPKPKKYVEFCYICGHKFPNNADGYCTQCGTKRLVYSIRDN